MQTLTYSAFTATDTAVDTADPIPAATPTGNLAGVVIDSDDLTDAEMLAIAAELGCSETAFLSDVTQGGARIRFFSPRAEIAFCGHATIASGVALAQHRGAGPSVNLQTNAGDVPVDVTSREATLTAPALGVESLADHLLADLLRALRLDDADLDPALPPAFLTGGNPHPLVFVRDGVLAHLDHDDDAVLALQNREGWDGTTPVVHRRTLSHFASRNPFPRGGIREDPATGSAAAGLGAYLRHGGHVPLPSVITVDQGREIGRPSTIRVDIPAEGRIRVTGTATSISPA
jgi:PhzF family phenazine biosynthesis protein